MTHIPQIEEILAEIHEGLGLRRDPRKSKFVGLGMERENHVGMARKLIEEIFDVLGMDGDERRDATVNALEFGGFQKVLELRTWTGNSSQQQVLWHLLAHAYVPALARRIAFWSLHNVENGQPALDAGMPGGKFWYLPEWDRRRNTVRLPVPKVLDWLLDILGTSSLYALQEKLAGNEAVVRTLQNWRNGSVPKSMEMIAQAFPDDSSLEFSGSFPLDGSLPLEEQFRAALSFVQGRHHSAETLQVEIPMSLERLVSIFDGGVSDGEKQEFVRCIAERYAKPDIPTIRRRLQIARLMQDGYKQLLEFLCPGVNPECADPAKNKLLQLVGLFESVYNLTIAAYKEADSEQEQNDWFEARVGDLGMDDLLLSILPSSHGVGSHELLAGRLTRQFMAFSPDSPLEDLVPWDENAAGPIIDRRFELIRQYHEEGVRLERLIQRVRTASPWRALHAEGSYWVIHQFVHREGLTPKIRSMALSRMRELASTPGQNIAADMIELGSLLHGMPDQRSPDVQQRVQSLLDVAQSSPGFEEWKAPLLRLRAKHQLFQNDFDAALKDFNAALEACTERAYGGLRGEIAWDGFATAIALQGFIPKNQERFYRNLLAFMEFPQGTPSFEDAAAECEEFFWSDLYHPYPGIERQDGPAVIQHKAIFDETVKLIGKADWDGLKSWLRQDANTFRKKNLKDARRNSVLLSWLKVTNLMGSVLPPGFMQNFRYAIRLLLEAWPEQAKIADFKMQTPLMLVADKGDVELTRLLLPLSDADTQDYLGRTALHAAVSGGSTQCVAVVLEQNPDVALVTEAEGNTALHTAIRFGIPEIVRLIIEEFPGMAMKTNAFGQTPLDMAREILEDVAGWSEFMRNKNRRTGSRKDFDEIVVLLTQSE